MEMCGRNSQKTFFFVFVVDVGNLVGGTIKLIGGLVELFGKNPSLEVCVKW